MQTPAATASLDSLTSLKPKSGFLRPLDEMVMLAIPTLGILGAILMMGYRRFNLGQAPPWTRRFYFWAPGPRACVEEDPASGALFRQSGETLGERKGLPPSIRLKTCGNFWREFGPAFAS